MFDRRENTSVEAMKMAKWAAENGKKVREEIEENLDDIKDDGRRSISGLIAGIIGQEKLGVYLSFTGDESIN